MNNRVRTSFDADYEALLQVRFPEIEWREPVEVTVPGISKRLVCRICIARYGLKADEVACNWPRSRQMFNKHMAENHHIK